MWADDIDGSLKKAGGDSNVITLQAPTREQIRASSPSSPNRPSRPTPWS